jgi:hypothetical protein
MSSFQYRPARGKSFPAFKNRRTMRWLTVRRGRPKGDSGNALLRQESSGVFFFFFFEDAPVTTKGFRRVEDDGHKIPASPCYGKKNPGDDGVEWYSKDFSEERERDKRERGVFGLRVSFFLKNEKVRSETMPLLF